MTQYARLSEAGLVLEICAQDPAGCFHPDIAIEFQVVPDAAVVGDTVTDEGDVIPAPVIVIEEPPAVIKPLSEAEFLAALTRSERIAIKALGATDPEVQDFLDMMKLQGSVSLVDADNADLIHRLADGGVLSAETVQKLLAEV